MKAALDGSHGLTEDLGDLAITVAAVVGEDDRLALIDGQIGQRGPHLVRDDARCDLGFEVVSPGGVGFDINCGVRLIRTDLDYKDILDVQEQLTQSLFDHIPVGVGSKGVLPTKAQDLEEALEMVWIDMI